MEFVATKYKNFCTELEMLLLLLITVQASQRWIHDLAREGWGEGGLNYTVLKETPFCCRLHSGACKNLSMDVFSDVAWYKFHRVENKKRSQPSTSCYHLAIFLNCPYWMYIS